MSWNYRVIENHGSYAVYEAYYRKNGSIEAVSAEPCFPAGETLSGLLDDMKHYRAALSKPVLKMVALEKLFEKRRQAREARTH
jgi:hypothetical protein